MMHEVGAAVRADFVLEQSLQQFDNQIFQWLLPHGTLVDRGGFTESQPEAVRHLVSVCLNPISPPEPPPGLGGYLHFKPWYPHDKGHAKI